ncbi:uncharacterized protein LOC105843164 isoform X2 [Hydra vulgaris]|uniref:Uncharacterized protein LOC105843164 isoform X2 n=1 Tax=Hydra vulgaris TaxID=6087 RepID=A0ABM4D9U6_HYDVU
MGNLLLRSPTDMVLKNPDELTSKCCGKICYKIGSDWFRWGRHLGLSDSDLDNIGSDNTKCYEKAVNVLKKWKQVNGNTSWEQLKNELISFERSDVVIEIEREFGDYLRTPEIKRYKPDDLPQQTNQEINKDISEISTALKNYYLVNYGKINEIQPPLKAPANVDLIHKFVDLCIVDSVDIQMDTVYSVERKEFLEKQMSYTPIPYGEVFIKEKSVILISGIAGIGKTWLLRKCLLDWSNDLIWTNVELVFYLECRRLNQYQNISNINELLNVFYKDIMNGFYINSHAALFIIDGLDEFKFFNELVNPNLSCSYPIVNALAEIQNYNHVVAGRVYAIDQYQCISTEHRDKLIIQVMGFNENGINNYIENNVMEGKKEVVKATLKESSIAKAMASVPFYLSSMCKIISGSKKLNKKFFLTMTDLYANIFLSFLRKHIIKNNKLVYEIMENESNKKYILNICKIAYELFIENKVIFSKEEIQTFISDFDKNEDNFFGFIERFETDLGCYYQFAHLTLMEFCASVYAYNCLSCEEIMANEELESCLSMICGLTNKSQNSLIKFLVNLNPSKKSHKESLLLSSVFDLSDDVNLFIESFYESQSSFTDEIKSFVDKRQGWSISIDNGKTSYETSCETYFVNHFIKSGRKLFSLYVRKNILSDEERNLLIQCSTNVRVVDFNQPIKFKGWKPKHKIEWLSVYISLNLSKKDFEENFLPWINVCERLDLSLHNDIDFIEGIYEWIRYLNIKKISIKYREKEFHNVDKLKNFITRKNV